MAASTSLHADLQLGGMVLSDAIPLAVRFAQQLREKVRAEAPEAIQTIGAIGELLQALESDFDSRVGVPVSKTSCHLLERRLKYQKQARAVSEAKLKEAVIRADGAKELGGQISKIWYIRVALALQYADWSPSMG